MVDQLVGGLFGGQDADDDDARRMRARDFVRRYEQGPPHEGYSDEEVVRNYRAVEGRLSPEEYEEAAAEAFGRLSPQERRRFRRMMKERSGGRFDVGSDDPRELARTTARFRQQDPGGGGLASLLGLGGDGGGGGDLLSAARGGGGGGGLFESPVAKAALAGVAAIAVKKVMDR
jgi:hypothetical protein